MSCLEPLLLTLPSPFQHVEWLVVVVVVVVVVVEPNVCAQK